MRVLIQRVASASVRVDEQLIGQIGLGLLLLLGVAESDTEDDLRLLAKKTLGLRIFDDAAGKMNLSLADVGGEVLVVSQFTLLADCRKGRRPSYIAAARPEKGEAFYERFIEEIRRAGVSTATGRFGASMQVTLVNDGPVTIWLDSETL